MSGWAALRFGWNCCQRLRSSPSSSILSIRNSRSIFMKSLALVSIALVLVALTAFAADHAMPPAEGSAAPAFTLPSQEGAQVSLDQFKGKWVVLYFYRKDFTKGAPTAPQITPRAWKRSVPSWNTTGGRFARATHF